MGSLAGWAWCGDAPPAGARSRGEAFRPACWFGSAGRLCFAWYGLADAVSTARPVWFAVSWRGERFGFVAEGEVWLVGVAVLGVLVQEAWLVCGVVCEDDAVDRAACPFVVELVDDDVLLPVRVRRDVSVPSAGHVGVAAAVVAHPLEDPGFPGAPAGGADLGDRDVGEGVDADAADVGAGWAGDAFAASADAVAVDVGGVAFGDGCRDGWGVDGDGGAGDEAFVLDGGDPHAASWWPWVMARMAAFAAVVSVPVARHTASASVRAWSTLSRRRLGRVVRKWRPPWGASVVQASWGVSTCLSAMAR